MKLPIDVLLEKVLTLTCHKLDTTIIQAHKQMRILSILFIFISTMGLSQFTPIWTIPSDYSGFVIKGFNSNETGDMMLISRPYDGGPISDLIVYTTSDFGQAWDSTYFANTSMLNDNAKVTESGNFYFASLVSIYSTTNPPGYIKKIVNRVVHF